MEQKDTAEHYPEFRSKLETLMTSGIIDSEKTSILAKGVRHFDRAFD